MNFFKSVLGSPAAIEIELEEASTRTTIDVAGPDEPSKIVKLPLFVENEAIRGSVKIQLDNGAKKLEHVGIRLSLIGVIKSTSGNVHEFLSVVKELESPGQFLEGKTYPFDFSQVERKHESYNGINISLNYYLKVVISRNLAPNISKQLEFWQHMWQKAPESNQNIKMEVGIEDCLHIEFEYNRSKYHLKDVIIGKIFFFACEIKNQEHEHLAHPARDNWLGSGHVQRKPYAVQVRDHGRCAGEGRGDSCAALSRWLRLVTNLQGCAQQVLCELYFEPGPGR